jgi:hypothetical protein
VRLKQLKRLTELLIRRTENVYWKDERIMGAPENNCQSFSDLQAQNKNLGYKIELLQNIFAESNSVPRLLIWAASQARKTVNQQI